MPEACCQSRAANGTSAVAESGVDRSRSGAEAEIQLGVPRKGAERSQWVGRRSDRGRGGVERIEYRALKKGALNEKAHGRTDEKLGAVKRGVVAWGDDDVGASLGGHEPL
eukprot:1074167-Rhodomonas_salina.1